MKKTLVGMGFSFLSVAILGNDIEVAHRYEKALEALEVEGNRAKAQYIIEEVMTKMDSRHELRDQVASTYLRVLDDDGKGRLQKAIDFVTGTKTEFYCKGVGMVSLTAKHNDGSTSTVKLGNGSRSFKDKDAYSTMSEGRWEYHLSNDRYRPEVHTSEVWIDKADANSFTIFELRNGKDGTSKGKYSAKWHEGKFNYNYNTNGNVEEPAPMYLAVDYQNWGVNDMGYRIKFKLGEKQTYTHSAENTMDNKHRILLKAERSVIQKHEKIEGGKFEDCFEVETIISLRGIEKGI